MNTSQQEAPPKLELVGISSADALQLALGSCDFSVPSRRERTHSHRENWTISKFLSAAMRSQILEFPLSLSPSEAPDFVLNIGTKVVGIEIAEAASQAYSEFMAYHEKNGSRSFIDIGHFRYGRKKIGKKIKPQPTAAENLTSPPWLGFEPEIEWSLFMKDVILRKLKNIEKAHYNRYAENWVLIYDNLPLPSIDIVHSVNLLVSITEIFNTIDSNNFGLFILKDNTLIEISHNNIKFLPIENYL